MPTKTVSTLNGVTQAVGVATSLIISANSLPVIRGIWGYCNGTGGTQYFLHFFNSATIPANGTVPLRSLQVLGGNGFGPYNYTESGLNPNLWVSPGIPGAAAATTPTPSSGLIVCLSTTEATLTIITGGGNMEIMVDVDDGAIPVPALTVVNSGGGLVTSLVVSNTPSTKKLVRFSAFNNAHSPNGYIMLYGYANPADGSIPLQQFTVPVGTTQIFEFGNGVANLQGNPTTYVQGTGIYLYGSSTTQTLTLSGNNWNLTAWIGS